LVTITTADAASSASVTRITKRLRRREVMTSPSPQGF
jgi:hypothetical protein